MVKIPHLETDITQACNLSCVACNHSVPLWRAHGPWQTNRIQLEADLTTLARIVHADRWGALGGEPLLHRDLAMLLAIAYNSGIADHIEVWTNGVLLPRMTREFWAAPFDILVLSVYPQQHDDDSLDWIRQRCADTGKTLVIKDERVKPNFRTLLEPVATNAAATHAKYHACFFRRFSRVANFGYFFTCCCAPHLPMLLQGQPYGTDGVKIDGLTEDRLLEYLRQDQPLGACAICAGRETAQPIPWSEERNPLVWVRKSAGLEAVN